ncbi:subtilisin-like protein [Xylariomycetidae sp. FL0641]|nr:subtilisin-like protein [Xylariomycetidae sp. FL0641]
MERLEHGSASTLQAPSFGLQDAGAWINIRVTVADFAVYGQDATGRRQVRTLRWVAMIQPTTRFGQARRMGVRASQVLKVEERPGAADDTLGTRDTAPDCTDAIVPRCLRTMYKMGNVQADPSVKSLFGIGGFLEQYAKHDALEEFTSRFAPWAQDQNFTTVSVHGGLDNQTDTVDDGIEANLDIQYAAALGYGNELKSYSTGGRGELDSNEPYLEILTYMLGLEDAELPPTSLDLVRRGRAEQSIPVEYVKKACTMCGQLGARVGLGPGQLRRVRILSLSLSPPPSLSPETAVSFSTGGGRGFPDVAAAAAGGHRIVVAGRARPVLVATGCTGTDFYSGLPTPCVPGAGWNATEGWDAVTALGTPLFDKLLELAAPGVTLPVFDD